MLIEDLKNTTGISAKEVELLLKTTHSEAFKNYKKGYTIYKGMSISTPKGQFLYLNPIKNRRSKNTANYYTLWLNNHPSWSEFPNRSVIATTNKNYASVFGHTYLVFPKNGIDIAVCPDFDFWQSFNKKTSPEILINELSNLFKDSLMYTENPKSYKHMLSLFKKFDSLENKEDYLEDIYIPKKYKTIIFKHGMAGLFERYFTPENFTLTSTSQFSIKGNYEVWFDSPFIAIPFNSENIKFLNTL